MIRKSFAFIDIFVDIIDNYGDIGWVEELIIRENKRVRYRIISSTPEAVESFLTRNHLDSQLYRVCSEDEYNPLGASSVVILSFHKKIDPKEFPLYTLFLRINYLSFQPYARAIHGLEHIESTSKRRIVELSYSPLDGTGGLFLSENSPISRVQFLQEMNLSAELAGKQWRLIFVYNKTLERLIFDEEDTLYFVLGRYSEAKKIAGPQSIILELPWIESSQLWGLLSLVDGSIVRGEVSLVRALQGKNPFYWDMYKEIGGWNQYESKSFLKWIGGDSIYQSNHNSLNTENTLISLKALFEGGAIDPKTKESIADFTETIQKTIDTYGFSI